MNRKLFRLYFYTLKSLLKVLVYIDSKIYMRFYNCLLKQTGITIIGRPRFIAYSVEFDDFKKITIGDRLVVSKNVYFLTHDYSYTTSLISKGTIPKTDIGIIKNIKIGDNVFIGMNSIILPGVQIGNNVIVGAGSVVRGHIPDNCIISGNPATIISSIERLADKFTNTENIEFRVDKK